MAISGYGNYTPSSRVPTPTTGSVSGTPTVNTTPSVTNQPAMTAGASTTPSVTNNVPTVKTHVYTANAPKTGNAATPAVAGTPNATPSAPSGTANVPTATSNASTVGTVATTIALGNIPYDKMVQVNGTSYYSKNGEIFLDSKCTRTPPPTATIPAKVYEEMNIPNPKDGNSVVGFTPTPTGLATTADAPTGTLSPLDLMDKAEKEARKIWDELQEELKDARSSLEAYIKAHMDSYRENAHCTHRVDVRSGAPFSYKIVNDLKYASFQTQVTYELNGVSHKINVILSDARFTYTGHPAYFTFIDSKFSYEPALPDYGAVFASVFENLEWSNGLIGPTRLQMPTPTPLSYPTSLPAYTPT